jgi:hypothetical protein
MVFQSHLINPESIKDLLSGLSQGVKYFRPRPKVGFTAKTSNFVKSKTKEISYLEKLNYYQMLTPRFTVPNAQGPGTGQF